MKVGDKVVCTKNWHSNIYVVNTIYAITKLIENNRTINEYKCYEVDNNFYFYSKINNDENDSSIQNCALDFLYNFDEYFCTLKKFRIKKIKKINESRGECSL